MVIKAKIISQQSPIRKGGDQSKSRRVRDNLKGARKDRKESFV
jgi:hypothetical protein